MKKVLIVGACCLALCACSEEKTEPSATETKAVITAMRYPNMCLAEQPNMTPVIFDKETQTYKAKTENMTPVVFDGETYRAVK